MLITWYCLNALLIFPISSCPASTSLSQDGRTSGYFMSWYLLVFHYVWKKQMCEWIFVCYCAIDFKLNNCSVNATYGNQLPLRYLLHCATRSVITSEPAVLWLWYLTIPWWRFNDNFLTAHLKWFHWSISSITDPKNAIVYNKPSCYNGFAFYFYIA